MIYIVNNLFPPKFLNSISIVTFYIRIKIYIHTLFKIIRGTFWQHIFLITPLIFSPMTSFVTSFCYIPLILELHHLFKELKFIFKKCILWLKLINMIRENVWRHFLYRISFLDLIAFFRTVTFFTT